MSKNEGRE